MLIFKNLKAVTFEGWLFYVFLRDTKKPTIMKNKYLFAMLLMIFFSGINVSNAQLMDDMEYPTLVIPASSTWWDCTVGCPKPTIVGPDAGHNSNYAGFVSGDMNTDFSLNLGQRTSGTWGLAFYMRVPQNKEAYWNLQAVVPFTNPEWPIGNIFFNSQNLTPGQAYIDWNTFDMSDDTFFNFPHDTWFSVLMNFDFTAGMAAATFSMSVNDVVVLPPGTAFKDGNGAIPTSLGGVNFNSVSTDHELYIDDFNFVNAVLGVEKKNLTNFSVYPNPANDEVNILFNEEIEEVRIYDLSGKLLLSGFSEKTVDVSNLTTGLYFMELSSIYGKSIQKFIKD